VKTYRITARRAPTGWNLHIPDIGVAPAKSLATAEKTAKTYIAAQTGATEAEMAVTIQPKLDITLGQAVQEARAAVEAMATAQTEAATKSRQVAAQLREAGLNNGDIAIVLGVSEQRVSQLFGKTGAAKS
jgi:DNA-directed RNA polymerase specialized sigma subunit